MKVLVNGISIRRGGAETWMVNLLGSLNLLGVDAQFTVIIRESRKHLYSRFNGQIDVVAIPDETLSPVPRRLIFEHYRIPSLHLERGFDVHFQANEMLSPAVAALGVPSICVFHTAQGNFGGGVFYARYTRFLRYYALRAASACVAVSRHMRDELRRLAPQRDSTIHVVYHGVDLELFRPGPAGRHPLLDYGVTRPYLLSVSNRFAWKNYCRVVQAYHVLATKYRAACDLVLVGDAVDADEEQRIKRCIRALRLEERVHLLPQLGWARLAEVYRGAEAYVFCSLLESFGMTVLEAMASGIPVVCGYNAPLPEIAGEAAQYCDPYDVQDIARSIATVIEDPGARDRLVRLGLSRARLFSWRAAAQQYWEIMKHAAGA